MSIDSQIYNFANDQEDTIPVYLKDLFRSVQQETSGQPSVGAFGSDLPGTDPEGMEGLGFGSLDSASKAHDSYAAGTLSNAGLRDALGVKDVETALKQHTYNRMARKVRPLVIQVIDYLGTTAKRSAVEQAVSKAMEEQGLEAATKETMAQINSIAEDKEGPGSVADAAAQDSRDADAAQAGMTGDAGPSDAPDTGNENQGNQGAEAGTSSGEGVGAGDESSSAPGHGSPGAWNTGGRVGALIQHLQTGGDVENAETDLGNANVPMGVVDDPDGAPSPFSGGTGVEDDLDMDVEAGSYVLNAEAVQLIGISDINAVIRDAYSIAAALGKPMPQDYDPQNKVPIRISNGEAVIPKSLVDIIGLDKLEKWNQKGLQLRKQKEEFMAQQQQAQPPQGPQVAAEAPMQQQMGQLMAKGGEAEEEKFYNVLTGKEETIAETIKETEKQAEKVESFLDIGSSSPNTIQGTSYKVGEGYSSRDMKGAIKAVSKVLGKSRSDYSEYKKLTATFLTEIANAESSFGRDETTNKKESNIVGPWQVSIKDREGKGLEESPLGDPAVATSAYQEILRRLDPNHMIIDKKGKLISGYRPKLQENLDKFIATSWGKKIDWLNLSKEDMMNPLVNATIARLYISTMDSKAIPDTKEGRAELWERMYNTKDDKKGTAAYYLSKNLDMP